MGGALELIVAVVILYCFFFGFFFSFFIDVPLPIRYLLVGGAPLRRFDRRIIAEAVRFVK